MVCRQATNPSSTIVPEAIFYLLPRWQWLIWSDRCLGQSSCAVLTYCLLLVHWTSAFINEEIQVVQCDLFLVNLCWLPMLTVFYVLSDHSLIKFNWILAWTDITFAGLNLGIHIFLSCFWKWLCYCKSKLWLDLEGIIHLEIPAHRKQLSRLQKGSLGGGTEHVMVQRPETQRSLRRYKWFSRRTVGAGGADGPEPRKPLKIRRSHRTLS